MPTDFDNEPLLRPAAAMAVYVQGYRNPKQPPGKLGGLAVAYESLFHFAFPQLLYHLALEKNLVNPLIPMKPSEMKEIVCKLFRNQRVYVFGARIGLEMDFLLAHKVKKVGGNTHGGEILAAAKALAPRGVISGLPLAEAILDRDFLKGGWTMGLSYNLLNLTRWADGPEGRGTVHSHNVSYEKLASGLLDASATAKLKELHIMPTCEESSPQFEGILTRHPRVSGWNSHADERAIERGTTYHVRFK